MARIGLRSYRRTERAPSAAAAEGPSAVEADDP